MTWGKPGQLLAVPPDIPELQAEFLGNIASNVLALLQNWDFGADLAGGFGSAEVL